MNWFRLWPASCRIWPLALALSLIAVEASADNHKLPEGSEAIIAEHLEPVDCRGTAPDDEQMIDETRRRLHETLCGASLWFDGLFGERRNIEAARGARGRVETSVTHSEFFGTKFRTRLDVRVDLPNLEERAELFFGRDDDDSFVRDRTEGFALRSQFPQLDDDDEWLAGLGYRLPGNRNFRSDFRVGVRNLRTPRAFVRNRIRYNAYSTSRSVVHFRLTPFWNTLDGFGVSPGFDYSYVLSPTRLLRWGNAGTVSEKTEGLDWRSALILYQGLPQGRGVALEGFVRGSTDDPGELVEYGSRLIFRQPLAKNRLTAELVSGYSFPKIDPDESRDGSFLVGLGLEMPFGGDASKR